MASLPAREARALYGLADDDRTQTGRLMGAQRHDVAESLANLNPDLFGEHPRVLVSCQARLGAKPDIVVPGCLTVRPYPHLVRRGGRWRLGQAVGSDGVASLLLPYSLSVISAQPHQGCSARSQGGGWRARKIHTADILGEPPCVVVSCQARIDAIPEIVVLGCRTMRPTTEREPRSNEDLLDANDGLELKTLCRCDLLFTVEKAKLGRRRGAVTPARRREIARRIIQGLAIAGM